MRISAHATVGRKTPADGKLEISQEFAERLLQEGVTVDVLVAGCRSPGRVEAMPCGCGKGGPGHVHFFLQSEPLRDLGVGTSLDLEGEPEQRLVRVRAAAPTGD